MDAVAAAAIPLPDSASPDTAATDPGPHSARRRLRTVAACGFMAAYFGALGVGLVAHTFSVGQNVHPLMYWVVWDMFCGWAAHESRVHVVAEGVSGTCYRVTPAPWGGLHPHGDIGREHYDPTGAHCARIALNVLAHTRHEPVTRLFVVEEAWPKKFNMPDAQWAARSDEPKDPRRYYHVRHVVTPEGAILQSHDSWFDRQGQFATLANPRLADEYNRSRPFVAVERLEVASGVAGDSSWR